MRVVILKKFGYCLAMVTLGMVAACSPKSSDGSSASTQTAPLSDTETLAARKAELNTLLDDYKVAADARKFGKIYDMSFPPRMEENMMKDYGITRSQLRTEVIKFMTQTFDQIDKFEYEIDMENADWNTLSDGTLYALLPTSVEMEMMGKTITADDENVAFYSDNRWYLVRVSEDEQKAMFKTAYPQFKDVTFKKATMDIK